MTTKSNPDFTLAVYPTIEKKLGRKLSAKENERFFWTSGAYKEYFYSYLKKCSGREQSEYLFNNGSLIGFPGYYPHESTIHDVKPRSLFRVILDALGWGL